MNCYSFLLLLFVTSFLRREKVLFRKSFSFYFHYIRGKDSGHITHKFHQMIGLEIVAGTQVDQGAVDIVAFII